MDQQPMLVWVNVRDAAIDDHKMQAVWGNGAVNEMVRRARARRTWLAGRIANRAHNVFLEPRRQLVGLNNRAGLAAPRRLGQGCVRRGLGGGARPRAERSGAYGARENDSAPE